MSTNITGKNIDVTPAIKAHVIQKTDQLKKHHAKIIQIDVEVDKNMHHKKGDVFHVRMNVQVPNELLHAEETLVDLYTAIDSCKDDIDRQLEKHKSKNHAKHRAERKGRRKLKSILSFWN